MFFSEDEEAVKCDSSNEFQIILNHWNSTPVILTVYQFCHFYICQQNFLFRRTENIIIINVPLYIIVFSGKRQAQFGGNCKFQSKIKFKGMQSWPCGY